MNKTQQAIIEATIDIVAEKGLDGFALREISKNIGISHTSVYFYYKTKDALLMDCFYLVNKEIADTFDFFNVPAETENIDAVEFFHKGWENYINFMIKNGNHSLFYYAYRDSVALEKVFMKNNTITARDMESFMQKFQELCVRLGFDNSIDMDYIWVYLIDCTGAFVKHIIRGHIPPERVDLEQIWKLTMSGLSALVRG